VVANLQPAEEAALPVEVERTPPAFKELKEQQVQLNEEQVFSQEQICIV